MAEAPIPVFNPVEIDNENMNEIKQRIGYNTDDFLWFGESVPEHLYQKCQMCNSTHRIQRAVMIKDKDIPKKCPECRRDALHTFDRKFWQHYLELKLWNYHLFRDQFDECYTTKKETTHYKIEPIKCEHQRGFLALSLKNRAVIDQSLVYMEGLARRGGVKHPLDIRVSERDGATWLDLCDEKWGAVKLDRDGWQKVAYPPILFRRHKHMLPLEIDEGGTKKDLEDFLGLMNFQTADDKILYCGFLIQGFVPNIDRPILMPTGPQGSAKTTLCAATRLLIDPSSIPYVNLSDDENELPQKILQNYLPTFDNCNYIPQEISDMLCQASSGLGFSKRKLFTDMDSIVYTARRALILNGISAPSMAPDLLDRTIMIGLERIPENTRREKREIEAIRDALLPKVRGYLLDVLVKSMNAAPEKHGSLPRLADFARCADAGLVQMGYQVGDYVKTYQTAAHDIAEQAVTSDPLAAVLLEYLADNPGGFNGSATELLKALETRAGNNTTRAPGWPKNQARLGDFLSGKLKPGLRMLGWVVSRERTMAGRTIHINKVGDGLKAW